MEEKGIKELKEAIEALMDISIFIAGRLKDGADIGDGFALAKFLLADEEFKPVLDKAIDGIGKIPGEITDLSAEEGLQLGGEFIVKHLPELLRALKSNA